MTTATHPAEAGFLREIIANPQSDADRLIFADWLDENGQSERGEFIRVQCELANREHTRMAGDGATRWHLETQALRRREREIVEKYGEAWIAEAGLPPGEVRIE